MRRRYESDAGPSRSATATSIGLVRLDRPRPRAWQWAIGANYHFDNRLTPGERWALSIRYRPLELVASDSMYAPFTRSDFQVTEGTEELVAESEPLQRVRERVEGDFAGMRYAPGAPPSEELVSRLNELLLDQDLYEKAAPLYSDKAAAQVGSPKGSELIKVNRRALEEVIPSVFKGLQTQRGKTVRPKVRKDVVYSLAIGQNRRDDWFVGVGARWTIWSARKPLPDPNAPPGAQ